MDFSPGTSPKATPPQAPSQPPPRSQGGVTLDADLGTAQQGNEKQGWDGWNDEEDGGQGWGEMDLADVVA